MSKRMTNTNMINTLQAMSCAVNCKNRAAIMLA